MTQNKKREWWIVHECESGEGFAYEHPCSTPIPNETHVVDHDSYMKVVAALDLADDLLNTPEHNQDDDWYALRKSVSKTLKEIEGGEE